MSGHISIKIGRADIVASGSVVLGAPSYGNFQCTMGDQRERVSYEFVFADDEADKTARVTLTAITPDLGRLTLYNFDNALGMGYVDPIGVGTIGGRVLKLSFVVHTIGAGRLLSYTFLLDELPTATISQAGGTPV